MVLSSNNSGMTDFGTDIPYDLRQIYATDIVGDHLRDVMQARKADNYSVYFKCLKDLFIVVKHKIQKKKVNMLNKEGKSEETSALVYYNALLNHAVNVANTYPSDWLGSTKSPEGCFNIETALNEIEMLLYSTIDEAKMFGGHGNTPGL